MGRKLKAYTLIMSETAKKNWSKTDLRLDILFIAPNRCKKVIPLYEIQK